MAILDADYSALDYDSLASSIGLKTKYIPVLIKSFFDETTLILEALEESIECNEYDKIRLNAHAIKGSAGNLKFSEIYEMAKEIEFEAAKKSSDFEYKLYLEAIKKAMNTISISSFV